MKKLIRLSKTKVYWMLQIFGWLSISLSGLLNQLFLDPDSFDFMYLIQPILLSLPGIIITHIYKEKFISPDLFAQSFLDIFLAGIRAIILVSVSLLVFSNIYYFFIYYKEEYLTLKLLLVQFINACVYIGGWFIIYFFYKILERSEEISSQKLQLEMKTKSAELELLKSQLNPEFLFQSLDSLRLIALKDKNIARDGIIKLSELLRFSLNYDKKPLISLKRELEEVQKYLELNQLKNDIQLHFTLDIKQESLAYKIPPALCLTVVEQIVQNLLSDKNGSIELTLTTSARNEMLDIAILIHTEKEIDTAIDFSKAKKRLQNYFGTDATILTKKRSSNLLSVTINYPTNPLKIETYELQSYNY